MNDIFAGASLFMFIGFCCFFSYLIGIGEGINFARKNGK